MKIHKFSKMMASAIVSMSMISGLTVVAPVSVAQPPTDNGGDEEDEDEDGGQVGPIYSTEILQAYNTGEEITISPTNPDSLGGVNCVADDAWPKFVTVDETTCVITINLSTNYAKGAFIGEKTYTPIVKLNGQEVEADQRAGEGEEQKGHVHLHAATDLYTPVVDKQNASVTVEKGSSTSVRVENTATSGCSVSSTNLPDGVTVKVEGENCSNLIFSADQNVETKDASLVTVVFTYADGSTDEKTVNVATSGGTVENTPDDANGGNKNDDATAGTVIGLGGILAAAIGIFVMLAQHCPFFHPMVKSLLHK